MGQYYGVGAHAIALDAAGRAYVTGSAISGYGFPTTPGALQATIGAGYQDAFLSVIDPSLSGAASLVYSTYLGPLDNTTTSGYAVAVDAYGNAYLTGSTNSTLFPITLHAFQATNLQDGCNGSSALCPTAFVTKINPNVFGPSGLIYSSYLGGTSPDGPHGGPYGDIGYSIAVDQLGNAYVGGQTASPNFPTTPGAYQPLPFNSNNCSFTGFVTKVNPYGTGLVYSTFLEQNCFETEVYGIALDVFNNAYVAGFTMDASPTSGTGTNGMFPITPGAYQPTNNGNGDAFLTELSASGSALVYSSFLGGSGYDSAAGVAVDAVGDVAVTGSTGSSNFPVMSAYQPVLSCSVVPGCINVFVTKFPLGAPGGLSITGIFPNSGGNAGTVSPQVLGTGFQSGATVTMTGPATITGTPPVIAGQGQTIATTFNLATAPPGAYNVVVTDPDGTTAALSSGFTVQQGGAPNRQISLAGVTGRAAPYDNTNVPTNAVALLTVSNLGNVDSPGILASEPMPSPFSLTSVSPAGLTTLAALTAGSEAMWSGPLAAGSSQVFTSTATTLSPMSPGPVPISARVMNKSDEPVYATCLYEGGLAIALKCPALADVIRDDCAQAWVNCSDGTVYCEENIQACESLLNICSREGADQLELGCTAKSCLEGSCLASSQMPSTAAADPNALVGPAGVGVQRWMSGAQALAYTIMFSNDSTATAPAQQVVVTEPLGPNANTSSLRLLGITIPNGTSAPAIQVPIPPGAFNPTIGLNNFTTNVDLRPTQSLVVAVNASLNPSPQTLTWTFASIDPTTGLPPTSPLVGFLAPGTGASVAFSVSPAAALATGAQVSEQAAVVFNANSPMNTKVWTNTLDSTPPVSQVKALPPHSCLDFKVSWSGTDTGSGIQDYTVYVSDTGGPFTAWQINSPATSATYQGEDGHSYGFYSIARDRVGNLELSNSAAEATTSVARTTTCGGPPSLTGSATVQSLSGTTLTLALQITNNGTETANNITVTKVVPIVLSGAGQVTLSSPTLPINVGALAPGASATVTLVLTVPSTVTNLSLIEPGTMQDAQANTYSYTLGQEVVP